MRKNAFEKWIGQTRTMKCGLKATIIAYRTATDADIRFENGIIREHIEVSAFKKGSISDKSTLKGDEHIGLTKTMNCGLKATIIEYRNTKDVDIRFENGTIRKHVGIYSFNQGIITETNIGKTKCMNCGLNATIIAYRNRKDIDVRFENGTIRKHIQMKSFHEGSIAETPLRTKNNYIGQTKMMNCGLNATVTSYRNAHDMDIRFEDGTLKENTRTELFNRGQISHPNENILFDTYKLNKAAFVFHNKTYFYVTYTENNSEIMDVMCVDDMKHKLSERTNEIK